jgi:DnaJ family protein C protein 10
MNIVGIIFLIILKKQLVASTVFLHTFVSFDQDMRNGLKIGSPYPWVVYFYLGETTADMELELKKLPALLPDMRLGKVNCGQWAALCQDLHIARYPLFAVFKLGGGHEIHHGRETAHDVANFARDSSAAPNVRVLAPPEFPGLLHSSHGKT